MTANPPERATRQAIVDTTARLLESQGYHGTGLNQIIKESGAPRGSLYYYFPEGKEELAVAALHQRSLHLAAIAAASMAGYADPVQAIDGFLRGMIEAMTGNDFCGAAPLAAVALDSFGGSERLRTATAASYEELRRPFLNILLRAGIPVERANSLATTVLATVEGAVILARSQQSTAPLQAIRHELCILIDGAYRQR